MIMQDFLPLKETEYKILWNIKTATKFGFFVFVFKVNMSFTFDPVAALL